MAVTFSVMRFQLLIGEVAGGAPPPITATPFSCETVLRRWALPRL
jgi:hypothetical protein